MKNLGYLLITVGFLAGSVYAVQTAENHVDWKYFIPAFLVGVVGVVLARVGAHREASHADKLSGDFSQLLKCIDSAVEKLTKIDAEKESTDVYALHEKIDEAMRDDLAGFADARESIGHLYSLADYAEVMNAFAAGERYVNRVWSASIDGWIDEAKEYLGRALEQLREAQSIVHALHAKGQS
ncbi:MAG: hypothetical protein GY716_11190 [bacterium]|nr:hypothetical protein [bacterium]